MVLSVRGVPSTGVSSDMVFSDDSRFLFGLLTVYRDLKDTIWLNMGTDFYKEVCLKSLVTVVI